MGFYTRFKDPEARAEIVRYYQFLKRHDDLFRWHQPHHETVLLFPRRAIHDGDVRPLARFREIGGQMLDNHRLFDILPDDAVSPQLAHRYRQIVSLEAETPLPPKLGSHEFTNIPKTVRVSLSKHPQRNEVALHLVNYNRIEPAEKHSAGRGIQDEKPLPVEGIHVSLQMPRNATVRSAEFLTPENSEPIPVEVQLTKENVLFVVPKFLVYGVVRLRYEN